METVDPRSLRVWRELEAEAAELRDVPLGTLVAEGSDRERRLVLDAGLLRIDATRQLVRARTLELLGELARETKVVELREAMFGGGHINTTEDRAVGHVWLRAPRGGAPVVDGIDVSSAVHDVLERMAEAAVRLRDGSWTGVTGERIERVVSIGIGGSDLGPRMAALALEAFGHGGPEVRFVSNVDPVDLERALVGAEPARTLFVVVSKTFRTLETLQNATAALAWLRSELGEGPEVVARHVVAVSSNVEAATAFGVDPANVFGFWDFVGGRYSVWSAVGFALMVAVGPEGFLSLLAGAHAMDEHFRTEPMDVNAPVLHGLLMLWYRTFLGAQTYAVLPYAERLALLPSYLQQLTMESNGKSVRRDGERVDYDTGAIVWGEPGTKGQHAFYQLLHQGTTLVPADIIVVAEAQAGPERHHDLLVANAFAQAQALAFGRDEASLRAAGVPERLVPHKRMPGSRPSSVVMMPRLAPETLGALIALYEHSVFVQGAVWGIDSFDQWGVELGKELADQLAPFTTGERDVEGADLDPTTARLIEWYRSWRQGPPKREEMP
ncbi:Glucose-6-phosphate isomerase [Acidimicrobium ferrooxidans DSM 10331]|uniref:Glucose-6-phosphate isomerase n=1 Tax=Acidimicrobium ferrooxidans (strain DSM 10331 / JCM 15462 / NBRC 103882 / ICP) TaxID=525909 RepID=C7LYY8_ACIFD|nr:glucose-6-phosphate isomerase [Acidimicrobium ferrooxidans]ACU53946.1 Glucose-6-phosphate isomerase [Acidimicrobium ferrooxidans DSM 10331]